MLDVDFERAFSITLEGVVLKISSGENSQTLQFPLLFPSNNFAFLPILKFVVKASSSVKWYVI